MDFNKALQKLQEDTVQDQQLAVKKAAALAKFQAAKQLQPGDDIIPDPSDPTGNKWKILPAAVKQQANNATLSR